MLDGGVVLVCGTARSLVDDDEDGAVDNGDDGVSLGSGVLRPT